MAEDRLVASLRALAEPIVTDAGAELVDVKVQGPKGGRTVKVTVDHDDGVGIDLIAEVTRAMSRALDDDEDLVPGRYTLEVTSPGVDVPLRTARHFARNVGRDVRVQLTKDRPAKTPGELTGRVVEVTTAGEGDDPSTGDVVVLDVKSRQHRLALDHIDHGKIVLPW